MYAIGERKKGSRKDFKPTTEPLFHSYVQAHNHIRDLESGDEMEFKPIRLVEGFKLNRAQKHIKELEHELELELIH